MKNRGFEIAKGFEQLKPLLPIRKTKKSAGYDLALLEKIQLNPGETKLAKTGIKAYMLEDEVLELYIRSSIAYKKKIVLANNVGIIDADYYNNEDNDGHIMLALINLSSEVVTFSKGEFIAQGIFKKYLTVDDDQVEFVRTGGFGSTTK